MKNFLEGPKSQISTLCIHRYVDGFKKFLVPCYAEEKNRKFKILLASLKTLTNFEEP